MRRAGILMPIFSISSEYGIGDFGKGAYKFIDFLESSGQSIWQILPTGVTSYGDSPYQSFSVFAGNPYFIDLEQILPSDVLKSAKVDTKYINYEEIYNTRYTLLHKAYENSSIECNDEFKAFCSENAFWLEDFALFMAVKKHFGNVSFKQWDDDIKYREHSAIEKYKKLLFDDINFHKYLQFVFAFQFKNLKSYANSKGIEIMGDIPIYVAVDSADVWSNKELFLLNSQYEESFVAGCPPDCFSQDGQLWGNPLYNWEYHKQTGYSWWISRIKHCFSQFDILRIDHFIGFSGYYAIPADHLNAKNGKWCAGPSIDLFIAIKQVLGEVNIIAEDLGILTDAVKKLLHDTGFDGMRVMGFGIFSCEDSYHLPHNYVKNSVVYTGTHDNETLMGAFENATEGEKGFALSYLDCSKENFARACINMLHKSCANTVIIPLSDYLHLSNDARINTPSTLGGNWIWRLDGQLLTEDLAKEIRQITKASFR